MTEFRSGLAYVDMLFSVPMTMVDHAGKRNGEKVEYTERPISSVRLMLCFEAVL